MPTFVVRCRKAPVAGARFLESVGEGAHVEFIAGMMTNALFISKGHRQDVKLRLVFEDSPDFSRTLTFDGAALGDLGGLSERALLKNCSLALNAASGIAKEAVVTAPNGIVVEALSFEKLIKRELLDSPCYLLHPKGAGMSAINPPSHATFIMTDQVPLAKNALRGLKRQGVELMSLGRTMLFASQCISIIHYNLDNAPEATMFD